MSRHVLIAVAVAALAVLVLVAWRGFFLRHALIVGFGVLALVYSIFRTSERLKSLHRK